MILLTTDIIFAGISFTYEIEALINNARLLFSLSLFNWFSFIYFGILRFYQLTWNLVKLPSLLAIVDYDLMKILTQKPSSFIWCNNRETFNFNFSDLKNIVHKIRTSKNSVGICSQNQILLVPNKSYEKPPEPVCI